MPSVKWEWTIGPQTIISGLNLLVMLGGVIAVMASVETDIRVAKDQVQDLRVAVTTLANAQIKQAVDEASVSAKVDLMLPMVQKLNDEIGAAQPRGRSPN